MGILNRLKIRYRVLIAVLVPVILTAGILQGLAIKQMQDNGEAELERLEEGLLDARKQGLKDLVDSARDIVMDVRADNRFTGAEAKEEARRRLRTISFNNGNYVFAYDRDLNNLAFAPDPSREGPTTSPDPRKLVSDLFDAAESGGFYAYDWINPGSGNIEPKVSFSTIIPGWDWMIGTGVYVTDIERKVDAAREALDASITESIVSSLIAGLLVVALSVVVGILVGRTVTNPIRKVTSMMQEIAEGDGDLRQRLPDEGTDELSELGARFNAFVVKIQNTIREVGSTTDQVASAAEELSRVANETRTSVQEQGSETDQIASAINEMAATIQQISGNANEVEGAASDADRMAREGGTTITSAQGAVNQLSSEIEETAASINALAEKSDDIQQVLDVIHAVTEQTNLLALNAAIEAARAGEHGRGFSVVADEVRQLAQRSAQSADQIREMIDGFVSESRAAVDRMENSRKSSDQTVERINHATDALKTIEASVGQIHDQVTQIATASEQQSQVAEEINQNVVRIVDAAQRSDDGVTQTNEASHELARLGESLRELVGQFKV